MRWLGEPKRQQRDQALTAGQRSSIVAELVQQRQRLL
jgi:hypothetical protein